jgi:hypothetical protein
LKWDPTVFIADVTNAFDATAISAGGAVKLAVGI